MARDDYDEMRQGWAEEAKPQSVTERVEEALGRILMKFKALEQTVDELEEKVDEIENKVDELRSDFDDHDWDDMDKRIGDVDTAVDELKDVLRNV